MVDGIERCKKCILPASHPGLTFDEFGICNKCIEHVKKWDNLNFKEQDKIVRHIFESAKKKKRKYDCIIGLSGGKDSSYVLYLCTKKYGLNPLCVTFHNGLVSLEALENIKKLIDKFNVDHIICKPDWEIMKRLYQHFLLTTGEMCTPCNIGIGSSLYDMAKKYKTPMIITGFSAYTDSNTDPSIYYLSPAYFRNVVNGYFTKNEIQDFLHFTTMRRGIYHMTGKIKYLQMPLYTKWDEREMVNILNREVGWKVERSISIEHTDCIASSLKEYLLINEFGFSEKVLKFSALVRNGFMTREEALAKAESFEAEIKKDRPEQISKLLQMLDLSEEDLTEAVKKRQGPYISKSMILIDSFVRNNTLIKKLLNK